MVSAGEYLAGDKLKSALIGKTFYAEHLKKGFKFKVYLDVDGQTAYRTSNSGITYVRVSNGEHTVSWYKVVQGKDL